MGLFSRLTDSLKRTKDQLFQRFEEVVQQADAPEARTKTSVAIDTLDMLEEVLISADVGVGATQAIVKAVGARSRRGESLRSLVKDEITKILDGAARPQPAVAPPRVVMIVGVNGTGKTTTVGKLARALKAQGQDPLVCAADTFRAAAVEQLEVWAQRAGVDMIRAKSGSDPAAVVFDALQAGRARGRDPILIDTAGRLHTRTNLMGELEKIRRITAREIPGAPHETLLVLDATVGQNGVTQAREFTAAAGVTGIVLTKLDGTAKGGVVVAISRELGLPVRYVGVGEKAGDLLPFNPRDFVDSLFA